MIDVQMQAEAVELIARIAAREGLTAVETITRAMGLEPVHVSATIARRFREIEAAADLEPGSVLEALLTFAEDWWDEGEKGAESLESWIGYGWNLEEPAQASRNLRTLREKWATEDALSGRVQAHYGRANKEGVVE